MDTIRTDVVKNFFKKIIRQKGQRAEQRAKELLLNQANQGDSNTIRDLYCSEEFNIGKMSRLIRWLMKKSCL